ncbi:MAG TPA: ketol-acid reductoisomerase [bacterium]
MKVYYEKDGDLKYLKGKTIAVVGYGNQGQAQAQNLRDSGVNVVVSEVDGTKNYSTAVEHGFKPVTALEAAEKSDLIQILVPDEHQADVYRNEIKNGLKKGKCISFSHGFNIHFHQIVPPSHVDVIMVAPKGPGYMVRQEYQKGRGVPALIAVQQDASGDAKKVALAYAKGIGALRTGVIETTFKDETETDLFGEQCVLCGGLTSLITAGFETLVEAGYPPEMAYFECLHEMKLIVDLVYEGGIANMRAAISNTAKYGDIISGPRLIDESVRERMRTILKEIQNGEFAREWILENRANRPVFNALLKKWATHSIEDVGEKLRAMMPWLKKEAKQEKK